MIGVEDFVVQCIERRIAALEQRLRLTGIRRYVFDPSTVEAWKTERDSLRQWLEQRKVQQGMVLEDGAELG